MKALGFSPAAQADIEGIWDYSADRWGPDQADRYTDEIRDACLALAGERARGQAVDLRPGYLKYRTGSHVIYYRDRGGPAGCHPRAAQPDGCGAASVGAGILYDMALANAAVYAWTMAAPDFSKPTIDTLARRARFQCSNPDCAVHTVGPNSDPEKATMIGEAAHIMGAKLGAARYDAAMSDVTRAAITNGIWLCRNCHGEIDRDAAAYPAELLFAWRKEHEERAARELGTRGDRIRYETEMAPFDFLSGYPPIIQRIVIDKPPGWEWRFVAELMRHLNKPQFKRLKNLQAGHYYSPQPRVQSDQFLSWVVERSRVMSNLVGLLASLIGRLTASWGEPGEPGDVEEMHDVCILIHGALTAIIDCEESLHFAHVPNEGEAIRTLLMNVVGPNAANLAEFPDKLDEVVAMIPTDHGGTAEEPLIIQWTFPFSLPDRFNERFEEALRLYERDILG